MQSSAQGLSEARQEALGRLLRSRPRSAEYYMARVDLVQQAGRLTQAEAALTTQVLADPDNWALRAALAYARRLQGRTAEAQAQLDKLPAAAFADPSLQILRATILADSGAAGRALGELNQALAAQPGNRQAILLRVKLLREAGKYQEALWELCQIISHYPDAGDAAGQVVELVQQGKLPLATVLQALDQVYPTAVNTEAIRGVTWKLAENPATDQAVVEQWLANHPRRLGEGG